MTVSSSRASSAARRSAASASRSSSAATGSPAGWRTALAKPAQRILEGRPHLGGRQAQPVAMAPSTLWAASGRRAPARTGRPRVGHQRVVGPQRLTVGAPVKANLPARQGFSGIPLALAALHQTWGAHTFFSRAASSEARAFVRPVGVGGPLGIDLVSIETNVGSPPTVSRTSPAASRSSTRAPSAQMAPTRPGVRQCDPRVLVDAADDIGEVNVVSHVSVAPVIGAADSGCGVADSGMWPSPANSPTSGPARSIRRRGCTPRSRRAGR